VAAGARASWELAVGAAAGGVVAWATDVLALESERPHPAVAPTSSSATAVTPAAQLGRHDPDIR
jgi:hypothetical protein